MNNCEHPKIICHPVLVPLRGNMEHEPIDIMRKCAICGEWLETKREREVNHDAP